MVFPKSPRLRFFVPEHGGDIVHLRRLRIVVESVFYKTSRHSRRAFGFKRHTSVALVGKSVHLLVDYVGSVAHAPQKQFGMLENGGSYFVKTVIPRYFSHRVFNVVPFVTFRR